MSAIDWTLVLLLIACAGGAMNRISSHWAELIAWLERPIELL